MDAVITIDDLRPVRVKYHSTFERFASLLPNFLYQFLFIKTAAFNYSKKLFGLGFGALLGFGIYLFLIDPLTLPLIAKTVILYILAVIFAAGWGFSRDFRCTTIIVILNCLGKQGRAYMLIFVFAVIFAGPGANLKHNFSEIPRTIGCTVELQINNAKMLWKVVTTPIKSVLKNIMQRSGDIKEVGKEVESSFHEQRDEVEGISGYNVQKEDVLKKYVPSNSTEQKFDLKNMLRCEYVVDLGINKCYEWFDVKHAECMAKIAVPLLNNLLCIPMQFTFLCGILNLGYTWCDKHLPREAGFGKVYDDTNLTVNYVEEKVSVEASFENEEDAGPGLNITDMNMKDRIVSVLQHNKQLIEPVTLLMKGIMACTFIFLFLSAYQYIREYKYNLRFDNCYVTTYFKEIDARRRKINKRTLLPLKRGERQDFKFPLSPWIYKPEMENIMAELRQCVMPVVVLCFIMAVDIFLYDMLEIFRRHSATTYVFASHHHLEIRVTGETTLANFLRRTAGLLNSSSNTYFTSNNDLCLPSPTKLTPMGYLVGWTPVIGLVFMSLLGTYFTRMRRAVVAYYYPKREKERILFLYNQQLAKRTTYADVKRRELMAQARLSGGTLRKGQGLFSRISSCVDNLFPKRCVVCDEGKTKKSYVCPTPDCGTVYCRQCWKDMRKFCFVCTPVDELIACPGRNDTVSPNRE